jgi:hypothetical protein
MKICPNCGHDIFVIRAICVDEESFECSIDNEGCPERESDGFNNAVLETIWEQYAKCIKCGHIFKY